MRGPISPLAASLTPYVPGEQPKAAERLLKLNTNENPYPPAPDVTSAIAGAIENLPLYPDPTSGALRAAIAQRHGVGIDQVFVGNGSDEVLALCFPAFFCEQPQPILYPDITYSFYDVFASLYRVNATHIPLRSDFTMDVNAFIETKNSGMLIANPNAPTGLALDPQHIARIASAHTKSAVIVDEAYVEFGARSMIPFIADHPNILVVRTLSKSHALAGLRVGYAVGNAEMIGALTRVKDSFNSYPLDRLAQAGATAAIQSDAYTKSRCRMVMDTRSRTASALKDRGFSVLDSISNFLFVRPPDANGGRWQQALRDKGILVRFFNKPRIDEWLRITIGTDTQMDRLIAAVDSIQNGASL